MARAASHSRLGLRVSVSIIRTTARAPICTRVNTAARLVRCTSNPSTSWGATDREVFLVLKGISAQIAAGLLLLLAAFVVVASVGSLMGHIETRPSLLGIGLLITASVVMPWLARQKRRLSGATASATLPADAAQSALCGYMAWIALTGLILNAIWSIGWADPVAALVLTPLILREGWETAKGKPCSCS